METPELRIYGSSICSRMNLLHCIEIGHHTVSPGFDGSVVDQIERDYNILFGACSL